MKISHWVPAHWVTVVMIASLSAVAGSASAQQPLTVCLEEDSPPYSYSFGKREGGFDFDLAHRLGKHLERDVRILWYEFEVEEDEIITLQGNALLSAGLCDLLGGYPLLDAWLAPPAQPLSKLPDYEGKSKLDRKRMVELAPLSVTRPYLASRLGIIAHPRAGGVISSIDDLKGVRTAAEFKSLGALILWQHNGGEFIDDLVTVRVKDGLFKSMDANVADATIAEVHRFERYRFQHAETKLKWTGYTHPEAYNFAFAALAASKELLGDVDQALAKMAADGTLATIGERNAITYFQPQ
jgi:hypothetical protein